MMPSPITPDRAPRRALAITFATLALTLAIVLPIARPALAGAAVTPVQPAANATVAQSPHQIVLDVSAATARRGGHADVYEADHARVASVALHRSGVHSGTLAAALPPQLPQGVYPVVWQLAGEGDRAGGAAGASGGAGASQGTFAFAIGAGGAGVLVKQAKPDDELTPVSRVIPRWLAFAAIMAFIGTLALRLLVTAPSVKRLADDEREVVGAASDRRLLVLAGASIALFVPATLGQLVDEATDPDAGLSFWQSIRPGAIGDYLSGTPDGHLWEIRLVLTALAVLVVVPAAVTALRPGWQHRPRRVGRVMMAGLVLGTSELVARVIPTRVPPSWPRDIFTRVLDWGHMLSASIWIGGLAGLVVLGAFLRVPADQRGRFFPIALRRFSIVATVCVGAMILTGLWTAWIHVGPPRLLFHTLYGETLLVKLILVLALVGLGAVNQLWLLPRVSAARESGGGRSAALRRFRTIIAAEAVLGLLILLVVPFLSGSARKQELQAKAADLTQTHQGVRFTPSGAQPGLTDYDLSVPGARGPVSVAFASPKLGLPATRVVATPRGGDDYRVRGIYTPVAGPWTVAVATASGPAATFGLSVAATQPDLPKPPPADRPGLDLGMGCR